MLTLAVICSAACIAGYILLSLTMNSLPPSARYLGWVALIESASGTQVDKATIYVDYDGEDVDFAIEACGSHPFHGQFLYSHVFHNNTGDVQYNYDYKGAIAPTGVQPPSIRSSKYLFIGSDFETAVRYISIDFPKVFPCSEKRGYEVLLTGASVSPWIQSSSGPWGLWHGPHAALSTPDIGRRLLDYDTSSSFKVSGLPGKWEQPSSVNAHIYVSTPDNWSINSAVPAPSEPNSAIWSSNSDINPYAQFVDDPSMASLEDLNVLLAVGVGIASGLVTTLLYEYLHPRKEHHSSTSTNEGQHSIKYEGSLSRSRTLTQQKSHLAIATLVLAIGYLLGRRRRP